MVDTIELVPTAMVAGGDGIARDADGRVVFVAGALPGERVRARLRHAKRDYARATTIDVLEPSPWRAEPPCPFVARGCGGCGWQHVTPEGQRALKRDIVRDALRRIAKLDGAHAHEVVREVVALPDTGYRTSARVAIDRGRAGFRRANRHDVVNVDACLVAHPLLEALFREGRFGRAREVELRVGARTGDRNALCDPSADGVELPDDVVVIGTDDLAAGREAAIEEVAAGRRWRISAPSFFQVRPDGADTLADLVTAAAGAPATVADLYSGVGLFAGVLAARGARVVAVEGDPSAAADARHNLAGLRAEVVAADVHDWRPAGRFDVVVADPSRHGLGSRGVETVLAGAPERIVLVSCDAAALGRDAGLLAASGFEVEEVVPVDLFPQTAHVETVGCFRRARPPRSGMSRRSGGLGGTPVMK
ncbi:MAG: TRAM domain-containing protein [Acidimicrobiia bacterium]